jgi:hypothetical protein
MATIDDAFKDVRKRFYRYSSHNAPNYSQHIGVTERKLKLDPGTLEQMFEEHCTISLHKYAERCSTAYNNRDRSNPVIPDIPYKKAIKELANEATGCIAPVVKKSTATKKPITSRSPADPKSIEISPKATSSQYPLMASVSISSNSRDYPISQEALDQYGAHYDIHDVLGDEDSTVDITSGLEDAIKRHGDHLTSGKIYGGGFKFHISKGIVDTLEIID